jgi:hypothetical protein
MSLVLPISAVGVVGAVTGYMLLEGGLRGSSTKAQRQKKVVHAWVGVVAGAVAVPRV